MASASGHITDRPVKVTTTYGKETLTTLQVHEWSQDERVKRIWKRLGMWWGAALFAALVPPHIPWFTIVFLGGPIAAWLASRQGAMIQKQQVVCPDCGTPSEIEEQAETWPLGVRCSPCRNVFWVSQVEAEAAQQPLGGGTQRSVERSQ